MNKQVKLKVKETAATNADFYNLFRPIAPSIDVIGKVAQVISGLTEAVTIWYITQSEMANVSKGISIVVSIIAMLLVVALLELGGRKFLQVLTRALVWKRLKNAWSIALFAIVFFITVGMGVLSFKMSTNGINHAFVSNVEVGLIFDNSDLKSDYRKNVKVISERMDNDLKVILDNHKGIMESTKTQYNARINAMQTKVNSYELKYKQGHKWAKSQADKYRKKMNAIEGDLANKLSKHQEAYTAQVDNWKADKSAAIDRERKELNTATEKGEAALMAKQASKHKNANFWGNLFSFFVGFSVILAFICIISVEVYRRGAGIEVEYEEEERVESIPMMFWKGMTGRIDNFFRTRAERFAQIPSPGTRTSGSRIGYYPTGMPTSEYDGDR